jgi:PhnB protein
MNDAGSHHVAEFSLQGQLFHLHENSERTACIDPVTLGGSTALVGLFIDDMNAWMTRAVAAGAEELSPAQDYDYGYRQGVVKDPFGHKWMIEQRI